jgi:glucose-6-phosphate 1-dehydrogenase
MDTLQPEHAPSTVGSAGRPGDCNLVIFGATGDLAGRKLVPALYNLARSGSLPERLCVIGVSRSVPDAAGWAARLEPLLRKYSRTGFDEGVWRRFTRTLETVSGDHTEPETYSRLRAKLDEVAERRRTGRSALHYLATPSSAFPTILPQLASAGLIHPPTPPQKRLASIAAAGDERAAPWTRVIIEKPFGRDLASARALNALTSATLDESQIFRIDHYLGKETVQNLLVLRFGNSIFEPLWNCKYVDHVEITAAEEIGIEGRGHFYEETGVVRDIVQNHLLQVLALCAMEPPISFDADEIRDMKAQVLRAVRPIDPSPLGDDVVFGQYAGYRAEPGVAAESRTPTFVAMRLYVDNWRWQGVPFYLRAGKGMPRRTTEVKVWFKPIPHCLFGREEVCLRIDPNVLTVRIQPDEGIALGVAAKVPGEDFAVDAVTMDFRYAQGFKNAPPEAYERLLLEAMRGDATLFARRDEVELAWKLVTPMLETWDESPAPIAMYPRGSEGPPAAATLIERDGRRWEPLLPNRAHAAAAAGGGDSTR